MTVLVSFYDTIIFVFKKIEVYSPWHSLSYFPAIRSCWEEAESLRPPLLLEAKQEKREEMKLLTHPHHHIHCG
jgi:hypothetical protein